MNLRELKNGDRITGVHHSHWTGKGARTGVLVVASRYQDEVDLYWTGSNTTEKYRINGSSLTRITPNRLTYVIQNVERVP